MTPKKLKTRSVSRERHSTYLKKANLVPSTRIENALLKRFQEHFGVSNPPPFNEQQRGILLAEKVSDDALEQLGGLRFSIRAVEFSYFGADGNEYLLVRDRRDAEPIPPPRVDNARRASTASRVKADGEDGRPTAEESAAFFRFYSEKLESLLVRDVFKPTDGWRRRQDRAWAQVVFSRETWEKSYEGFVVGQYSDEEGGDRKTYLWVGVHVRPKKHAPQLLTELRKLEGAIRERLGPDYFLEEVPCWSPIWEVVQDDNPQAIASHLKRYKELLTPCLEQTLKR